MDLINNRALLIDFGCSVLDKNETLRNFPGTKIYQCPEFHQYGGYIGTHATVWSLGVLLYCITQVDEPFPSSMEYDFPPIKFVRSTSEKLKSLIRGCLNEIPLLRLTLQQINDQPWMRTGKSKKAKKNVICTAIKQSILRVNPANCDVCYHAPCCCKLSEDNRDNPVKI